MCTYTLINDLKIKILPSGEIMVERREDAYNETLYNLVADAAKDKAALSRFLFKWKGRQVLFGDPSLCG